MSEKKVLLYSVPELMERGWKFDKAGWLESPEGHFVRPTSLTSLGTEQLARYWSEHLHKEVVSEEVKEKLNITENDVGRKVRHKDGSVSMIIIFDAGDNYPVLSGDDWFTVDGRLAGEKSHDKDIIEFID